VDRVTKDMETGGISCGGSGFRWRGIKFPADWRRKISQIDADHILISAKISAFFLRQSAGNTHYQNVHFCVNLRVFSAPICGKHPLSKCSFLRESARFFCANLRETPIIKMFISA
jgi:hypothetical protein